MYPLRGEAWFMAVQMCLLSLQMSGAMQTVSDNLQCWLARLVF